jgi:threonine dehydrogenase-like Zn-dependent dehydrogenase
MEARKLEAREVRMRPMAAGVCGTDVHIFRGERGSASVTPPVVLGHEFSGIVEETGEAIEGIQPGDHVTIDPNMYCGKCRYCRNGQKQFCENLRAVGVNFNGGFAEECIVPDSQVFRLDQGLSFEEGAMAEPLACCIHGIEQIDIHCGDTICVIGGGAIGQIMIQLAKLRGAGKVLLSEPLEFRRAMGLKMGADGAFDPSGKGIREQLAALTGRDSADVVIECAGNVHATRNAIEAADRGARILLFSVPRPDSTFELPLFDVFSKELKVSGSFINPDSHLKAVRLLNEGRVNMKPLISHRFPLERVREAIMKQTDKDAMKVMILPNGEAKY